MIILALLVMFLSLCSFPAFASAVLHKKFEFGLPIEAGGLVMFLFFFGVLNQLKTGFYFCVVVNILLWVVAIVFVIKNRSFRDSLKNFLSNGFWLAILVYLFSIFALYGMRIHCGDEYVHWGKVVMYMTTFDDLGTNPLADCLYGNYVPGMSLFQYYFEKMYLFICGRNSLFADWLLYLAYHVMVGAFIIPVVTCMKLKNLFADICTTAIIILTSFAFFRGYYYNLYFILQVDAAIGIIFGLSISFVLISLRNWKNAKNNVFCYLLFACFILAFLKNASILQAIVIVAVWCMIEFTQKESKKEIIISTMLLLGTIVLTRVLWNLFCSQSSVSFGNSNSISVFNFLRVLFVNDGTYRTEVRKTFFKAFFDINAGAGEFESQMQPYFILGDSNIKLSYFSVFAIFYTIIFSLSYALRKFTQYKTIGTIAKRVGFFLLIFNCIWIMGMLAAYLYEFGEHDYLYLVSFFRYNNSVLISLWFYIIFLLFELIKSIKNSRVKALLVVLGIFLCLSFSTGKEANRLLSRELVNESIRINDQVGESDAILSRYIMLKNEDSK